MSDTNKHMVYAEDILQELIKHPDNAIYKWELKNIIDKVVHEKEVTIGMCDTESRWEERAMELEALRQENDRINAQ